MANDLLRARLPWSTNCIRRDLVSLDLSLAFDRVPTAVVAEVAAHLGRDLHILAVLRTAWRKQTRYLQYQGVTTGEAMLTAGPLAQGDSWSPIMMDVFLLALFLATTAKHPSVQHMSYVDDRAGIGSVDDIDDIVGWTRSWSELSEWVGLRENITKAKLWPATRVAEEEVRKHEGAKKFMTRALTLLGFELDHDGVYAKQKERIHKAHARLRKIALLPVDRAVKKRMVAAFAVPAAAYGWIAPPAVTHCSTWASEVRRCLRLARHGQPDLGRLLVGHGLDLECTTTIRHIRVTTKRLRTLGAMLWMGPWMQQTKVCMRRLGLSLVGRWRWQSATANCVVNLNAIATDLEPQLADGKFLHDLRQSWRWARVCQWRRSGRRDACDCADAEVTPKRIDALRKVEFNADEYAIMTGAFVSPARFAVMTGAEAQDALCSQCGETLSFMHCMWTCPLTRVAQRPPEDLLLPRLGWPRPGRTTVHDRALLANMASLRAALVAQRHAGR